MNGDLRPPRIERLLGPRRVRSASVGLRFGGLSCLLATAVGCASGGGSTSNEAGARVIYDQGKAYALRGGRRWAISEVDREQMVWSPDHKMFAYVKKQRGESSVVVRDRRGSSVNEFVVQRLARPVALGWLDPRRVYYRVASETFLVRDVRSASYQQLEGQRFSWSASHKRLAYVTARKGREIVKVDSVQVWPRSKTAGPKRRVVSGPIWSPDGEGLAFIESTRGLTRLVVLLVIDNPTGDLTWNVPAGAADPKNKLFWMKNKVLIGSSMLKPRFSAGWRRTR